MMQAFGQGSLAHQTAEGGTGLGLPIVQNLVNLHGGTFELLSELRKGTRSHCIAPQKPGLAHHAAAAAAGPGAPPPARSAAPKRLPTEAAKALEPARAEWHGHPQSLAEAHCHATGRFLHSAQATRGQSPQLGGDEEANPVPLHQCVRDRCRHRALRGVRRSLDEIARWQTMTDAERQRIMRELPAQAGPAPKAAERMTMGAWIALTLLVIAGLALLLRADAGSIAGFDPSDFAIAVASVALLDLSGLVDRRQLSRQGRSSRA